MEPLLELLRERGLACSRQPADDDQSRATCHGVAAFLRTHANVKTVSYDREFAPSHRRYWGGQEATVMIGGHFSEDHTGDIQSATHAER